MNFSSSISAFVAKFEIQDIAEFLAIQLCDSRVLIILGCRIFPYLQTPEIAFLRTKDIQEYTIREKAAKILTRNFSDPELLKAKEALKNDSNYYVRRF